MGGIAVDRRMATRVPGLFAAGEAAGGANGANRLSGNAIPEALVFGECAGRCAAAYAGARSGRSLGWHRRFAGVAVERIRSLAEGRSGDASPVRMLDELRELMWTKVGPFRTAAGLTDATRRLTGMRAALHHTAILPGRQFNPTLSDWFELRASLIAAEAVAHAALAREESRGAHQREDFPDTDPAWGRSQHVRMTGDGTLTTGVGR
jgi:succinate dehydrogenase / fumarate reductase flavoprotein subunit/fumarate reductase (CoM/CoB) subunit A